MGIYEVSSKNNYKFRDCVVLEVVLYWRSCCTGALCCMLCMDI